MDMKQNINDFMDYKDMESFDLHINSSYANKIIDDISNLSY